MAINCLICVIETRKSKSATIQICPNFVKCWPNTVVVPIKPFYLSCLPVRLFGGGTPSS